MPSFSTRNRLRRVVGGLATLAALAVLAVLLDFIIDIRPAGIAASYRFSINEPAFDRPAILRSNNLVILLIRRSPQTRERLRAASRTLADPDSRRSRQPAAAANALRSLHEEYFVAYARGTDFGCELVAEGNHLREICGSASYDFAGRALPGERVVHNLSIPDYHFSADFKQLVVKP